MEEHQQAQRRIVALRETSATLDQQLTELLTALSQTRQELIAVPSTRFPGKPKDIPYTELIAYASKISKFSRPPNPAAVKHMVDLVTPPTRPAEEDEAQGEKPPVENSAEKQKLPLGLSEEDISDLDPSNQMPVFMPWPSETVMRIGALAAVGPHGVPQDMVPEVDKRAEEEAREEEARKKVEEEQRELKEREERERAQSAAAAAAAARRDNYGHPQPPREQPKLNLSLSLFDEEEED